MPDLFSRLDLPGLQLPNRMIMAPMTRGRADGGGVPNAAMVEYYSARADAGLLITEGVCVSLRGLGWNGAPGIYERRQIEGWQRVTEAVHTRGGRIYAQLWFLGRLSHPDFLNGARPWAPSAIRANQHVHAPDGQKKDCVKPHAMTADEIAAAVKDFGAAASLAVDAGFDGVQLHGAGGYIIDQFLRSSTNHRTDSYGGSIPNRLRFLREVVDACASAIGGSRVCVRLSPRNTYNDIDDHDPIALFGGAAEAMGDYGLSFLEVMEGLPGHFIHQPGPIGLPVMRAAFPGIVVANGGYDKAIADGAIRRGEVDAVAFGIPFLGTPDVVERFRRDAPLNPVDPDTFYSQGEPGYNDYPTLAEASFAAGEYRTLSLAEARNHQ